MSIAYELFVTSLLVVPILAGVVVATVGCYWLFSRWRVFVDIVVFLFLFAGYVLSGDRTKWWETDE